MSRYSSSHTQKTNEYLVIERKNEKMIKTNQALLVIIKDGNGEQTQLLTHDYRVRKDSATKWYSHYGTLDIAYSWRASYLMLEREDSGFYTGVPLSTETFIVTNPEDAYAQARAIYQKNHKVVSKPVYVAMSGLTALLNKPPRW